MSGRSRLAKKSQSLRGVRVLLPDCYPRTTFPPMPKPLKVLAGYAFFTRKGVRLRSHVTCRASFFTCFVPAGCPRTPSPFPRAARTLRKNTCVLPVSFPQARVPPPALLPIGFFLTCLVPATARQGTCASPGDHCLFTRFLRTEPQAPSPHGAWGVDVCFLYMFRTRGVHPNHARCILRLCFLYMFRTCFVPADTLVPTFFTQIVNF